MSAANGEGVFVEEMRMDYLLTLLFNDLLDDYDFRSFLAKIQMLYGQDAANRLDEQIFSSPNWGLIRLLSTLSVELKVLSFCPLETLILFLGMDLASCLTGCVLKPELPFTQWDDDYDIECNFEEVCECLSSIFGPEIESDFRRLIYVLGLYDCSMEIRVSSVLEHTYGSYGVWRAAASDLYERWKRARLPIDWSALRAD